MKTAISIPDSVFDAAERAAKRLGVSRSELYSCAVREYLERHKSVGVTKKLNQVYSAEESKLDANIQTMQSRTLSAGDW